MSNQILITGGTLIDGTGAEPRPTAGRSLTPAEADDRPVA